MVSIILVSHGSIASSIYDVAKTIMPDYTGDVMLVSDCDNAFESRLTQIVKQVKYKEVLILTDLCGATPDNVVKRLLNQYNIAIISGLSLPMLLKAFNYSDRPLPELIDILRSSTSQYAMLCYSEL